MKRGTGSKSGISKKKILVPAVLIAVCAAGVALFLFRFNFPSPGGDGGSTFSAVFSLSPSYSIYLLEEPIQFSPQVGEDVSVEYFWDFGDGTTSNKREPVHMYTEPGEYKVSLTVTDGAGRTDNFSTAVRVVGPSLVTIENDNGSIRLLVNGEPFVIRGVSYSPTPVGKSPAMGYNWWSDPGTYLNDFPLLREMGANTIRTYGSNATREALDYAYANGIYVIMGHWVNHYLNLSVASNRQSEIEKYLTYVRAWKNHPAVLMWSFGNEVEYNYLTAGGGRRLSDWYTMLEEACKAIKAEDNLHPTTYSHVDRLGLGGIGDSSIFADDANLSALDIWGVNVYRGPSFGTFFEEYARCSGKPLILSEWGCDAWNGVTGSEDQSMQAEYIRSQWSEIERNLAPTGVCLGVTVFEWCDEWWKAGRPLTQETTSQWQNPNYEDPNMNEEWWGISSVSPNTYEKTPRKAYYVLRELWTGSTSPFFTISASPSMVVLAPGENCEVRVRVMSVGGYEKQVSLSVSGQPSGISVRFLPASGLPSFESTMTITVGPQVSSGTHVLTVTGIGEDNASSGYRFSLVISSGSAQPSEAYSVYSDSGIPSDAEVWTWSGKDWGMAGGEFDGEYTAETPPEGTRCFMTKSGSGAGNYAGWGVFLIYPSSHTKDLSGYAELRFWVKTPVNLKVEVQDSRNRKSTKYISSYGWDGTNSWQEIIIPRPHFTLADITGIFGVFLITASSPDTTFYVDNVRWVT